MKLSVLNVVPIKEGQTFKDAIEDMVKLAQAVEQLGYTRYWIAEHHNSPYLGASATQLLIQQTLSQTSRIRVGSGGVMLPNHSPYLVAEQYGTLDALYPNRVDLGLGRAPGTDGATAKAIRRKEPWDINFEKDFKELQNYFDGYSDVKAYPAFGRKIPYYILGSSLDSAYLAAEKGLPYAFAAHFAPALLEEAANTYRSHFKPSKYLEKPYFILTYNIILAKTVEEAKRLSTSHLQSVIGIITSQRIPLQPPKENEVEVWKNYVQTNKVPHFGPIAFTSNQFISQEKNIVHQMMAGTIIGTKATAIQKLNELKEKFEFEELMAHSFIFDLQDQINSYRLLKEAISEFEKGKCDLI